MGGEIFARPAPERLFRAAGRRPVMVGRIEMRDRGFDRAQNHPARVAEVVVSAEVVPEAGGERGKSDPVSSAAPGVHGEAGIADRHPPAYPAVLRDPQLCRIFR